MPPEVPPERSGFFSRLRDGLRKTRDSFVGKIEAVFAGAVIDEGVAPLLSAKGRSGRDALVLWLAVAAMAALMAVKMVVR